MTETMYFVVPKTRTVASAKTSVKTTPLACLVDGVKDRYTPVVIGDMTGFYAFKIPGFIYDENKDNIETCRKKINNGTILMTESEFQAFRKDKILAIDAPRDITLAAVKI
jgi:hypothetical protein